MSVKFVRWPLWAALLATLVLPLTPGCSRYDSYERNMERNMRYVSSEVLVSESVVSFERLRAAHDAWVSTSRPEALDTFRDMYSQYEVIYNELMDRAGGRLVNHLAKFSGVMPPPPPGVTIEGLPMTPLPTPSARDGAARSAAPLDYIPPSKPAKAQPPSAQAEEASVQEPSEPPVKAATPRKPAKSEKSRSADSPADAAEPSAVKPAKPQAAVPATDEISPDGAYTLRPGDTPRLLAKRFRVSEERLMAVNAITDPQRLAVGQKIVIPRD